MARFDPDRVRSAQLAGAATALKDLCWQSPERFERLRSDWPEFAERIDRILELVTPPGAPSV